jgi:hypothetical protein
MFCMSAIHHKTWVCMWVELAIYLTCKADLEHVRNMLAFWFQPEVRALHQQMLSVDTFKELEDTRH